MNDSARGTSLSGEMPRFGRWIIALCLPALNVAGCGSDPNQGDPSDDTLHEATAAVLSCPSTTMGADGNPLTETYSLEVINRKLRLHANFAASLGLKSRVADCDTARWFMGRYNDYAGTHPGELDDPNPSPLAYPGPPPWEGPDLSNIEVPKLIGGTVAFNYPVVQLIAFGPR